MMDTALWSVIIPAVAGLLSGVVGSLSAPWVAWVIEKRREKMRYRREFIQRCREKIEAPDFDKLTFAASHEYRLLRPYLTEQQAQVMQSAGCMLVQLGQTDRGGYRCLLSNALEKLEKDWALI